MNDQGKRNVVKGIAAGTALALWHKPVVDTVILPVHAQTSDPSSSGSSSGGSSSSSSSSSSSTGGTSSSSGSSSTGGSTSSSGSSTGGASSGGASGGGSCDSLATLDFGFDRHHFENKGDVKIFYVRNTSEDMVTDVQVSITGGPFAGNFGITHYDPEIPGQSTGIVIVIFHGNGECPLDKPTALLNISAISCNSRVGNGIELSAVCPTTLTSS